MKRKTIFTSVILIFVLCGCGKNIFINETKEPETKGFIQTEYVIENNNQEYYSKIADLKNIKYPKMLEEMTEYKYGSVGPSLTWKLDCNIDNPDEKYHVIVQYYEEFDESVNYEQIYIYMIERIDEINEECNLNLNVKEWVKLEFDYYCILTREEIKALGTSGQFFVWYVGSGDGEYTTLDTSTYEGVSAFVELYGDGYVQCIDGKEIKEIY